MIEDIDTSHLADDGGRDGVNGLMEADLECGCCYCVMLDPTTLNCGHSFCRYCLARWWKSSKQNKCPECRQPWLGFPRINVLLRNAINRLFPDEVALRMQEIDNDEEYRTVMERFEVYGQKLNSTQEKAAASDETLNFYKICIFVLVVILLLIVLVFILQVLWVSDDSLALKPVKRWTKEDVANWVRMLGPWAEEEYYSNFLHQGINGKLLLSLRESDLTRSLGVQTPLHLRTIMNAIETLKFYGIKPPTDFFEFKAVYRSKSMFLLFGLREFPRATMMYTYLFDYETLFVPLIKYTNDFSDDQMDFVPLTETVRGVLRIFLFPYYLIGKFAWQWMDVNFWTTRIIFVTSVLMTIAEIIQTRWLFTGGWRTLPKSFIKYGFLVVGNSLFHRLLWPLLPNFIADVIFYWLLYLSPLDGIHKVKQAVTNSSHTGGTQLLTIISRWLWGKTRHVVSRLFHLVMR